MQPRHIILIILSLVLLSTLTRADLGPKPHLTLIITDENGNEIKDSIILCTDSFRPVATKAENLFEYINESTGFSIDESVMVGVTEQLIAFGTKYCTILEGGRTTLWFYGLPDKISLVYPIEEGINKNTKVYTTTIEYLPNVLDQTVKVEIGDDIKSKNITPTRTLLNSKFLVSLFLTIIIEVGFSSMVFRRFGIRKNMKKYVLLANIITVPILWVGVGYLTLYVFSYVASLLTMEIIVILIESLIYHNALRNTNIVPILKVSLLLNIASFVIGLPIVTFLELSGII